MSGSETVDYLVAGHVTRDVVPVTGVARIGGTAFWSGLQAARLGLRTRVLTAGDPDEIAELAAPFADELEIVVQPRPETTGFEATGVGAERRLRVTSWAGALEAPSEPLAARVVHLAPVARETGTLAKLPAAGLVGLTPQGLIRRWDDTADGEVRHVALDPAELPRPLGAMVLAEDERAECAEAIATAVAAGAVASVTLGDLGAEVQDAEGAIRAAPPLAVEPLEDLGAGDVYAAAFFAALADGLAPREAMARGQAAAVLRLAGAGPAAVAGGDRIAELAAA